MKLYLLRLGPAVPMFSVFFICFSLFPNFTLAPFHFMIFFGLHAVSLRHPFGHSPAGKEPESPPKSSLLGHSAFGDVVRRVDLQGNHYAFKKISGAVVQHRGMEHTVQAEINSLQVCQGSRFVVDFFHRTCPEILPGIQQGHQAPGDFRAMPSEGWQRIHQRFERPVRQQPAKPEGSTWKQIPIDGVPFKVPARFELIKKVGSGASGTVVKLQSGQAQVAVKKVTVGHDTHHSLVDGKRLIREVKLLRSLKHENVINILDMYLQQNPHCDEIYLVSDLMETDLHRIIVSKQVLSEEHHQYFSYQILRGLKYLHSANVVHRDLKPANILANKDCHLKICDFGLARALGEQEEDNANLTDYVVTRWYRAPEVTLLPKSYTKSIDVWSVGCILCELIRRRPIFTGEGPLDQIVKILQVLGPPKEDDLTLLSQRARTFLEQVLPYLPATKLDWKSVCPKATEAGAEAIERMLTFNPKRRATAGECLELKYFHDFHRPDDEPVAEGPIDWTFENCTLTKESVQNEIYAECRKFYPEMAQATLFE